LVDDHKSSVHGHWMNFKGVKEVATVWQWGLVPQR